MSQILNPGMEGNLEPRTSALYSGKDSEAVKSQRHSSEASELLAFALVSNQPRVNLRGCTDAVSNAAI